MTPSAHALEPPARFLPGYRLARAHFLTRAQASGARVHSHPMALKGLEGETLAMDVSVQGPADAPRVLMTTSGVHGIEGFCGSALQSGLLGQLSPGPDMAIVHVHAVNPHGFSFGRRVNEDNVDLNRNFIDFAQPLPVNTDYGEIHDLLLPRHWPPDAGGEAQLAERASRWGARRMQLAITGGQYHEPAGLWFGGTSPTWSQRVFRQVLREHIGHAREVAWIDLHTGLGPHGVGERIFACTDSGATLERARRWWGEDITSVHTGTSHSIPMSGPIQMALYEECVHARYTGICLEFGTCPLPDMVMALRAGHWLHRQEGVPQALARQIRERLREAFCPHSPAWQDSVWQQALQAAHQALQGLAHDPD